MSPPVIGLVSPAGLPGSCAVSVRRGPGRRLVPDAAGAGRRRRQRHPAGTASGDLPKQQRALAGERARILSVLGWLCKRLGCMERVGAQHCTLSVHWPRTIPVLPAGMPSRLHPPRPLQSTPLAQPAASAEFLPEDMEYWKGTVLAAAWPALIGLGIAAAALLIFLLW